MEHQTSQISWEDLIFAFLHDPPDKAVDIRGHEGRARFYLETATDSIVDRRQIKMMADVDAAIAERLPMPTAGSQGERAVGPDASGVLVNHPLSAAAINLSAPAIDKEGVSNCMRDITDGLERPKDVFLSLWRLLPEKLAELDPAYLLLPADTRVPDHTIWNHLDVTAALKGAESGGGVAFLSFSIGPVQEFIAAARSVQDLWAGSMLLSWLSFNAIRPVLEAVGPSALVYPALRGLPWLDHWLRDDPALKDTIPAPTKAALAVPCLPNRFLAVVPRDGADGLARRCEDSCREAWHQVARTVRGLLDPVFSALAGGGGWDRRWDDQSDGYFGIHVSSFARRDCSESLLVSRLGRPIAPRARELADLIPNAHRPRYEQKSAGTWQALVEYAGRLLEARRMVRHIPKSLPADDGGRVPKKCSLLGSFEQMGPDNLGESASFWQEAAQKTVCGVRVRAGEQLCAVSLVKRFCGAAFFEPHLGLDRSARIFDDTATVAARYWLDSASIDTGRERPWNGQWLHWPRKNFDEDEEPVPDALWAKIRAGRESDKLGPVPSYYCVLMLDGDDMGQWLSGERAPNIGEVLHPKLKAYFESLGGSTAAILDSKRPVGPAMHAAISQALSQFALHVVPSTVEKHKGTLIYSGGDDVLALLPTTSAVECALELYQAFRGETGKGAPDGFHRHQTKDLLMMGPTATLSGGLAIVHYKSDLRGALAEARLAEKDAKRKGKDAIEIKACRRSGQHSRFLCPWAFVDHFRRFVAAFVAGASDRFAYHLAAEAPTLCGLPVAAQRSAIKRHIGRAEKETRAILARTVGEKDDYAAAAEVLAASFELFCEQLSGRGSVTGETSLELFTTLLQTASFMARGRDI